MRDPGQSSSTVIAMSWPPASNASSPSHLRPGLSQAEEMLIARAHVHVEAKRVRGHQYQYTGHTIYFMNNSTKLYDTLPLLPHQLDLLLLRPNQSCGPKAVRQRLKGQAFEHRPMASLFE